MPIPTYPPAPLRGITIKLPETLAVAGPVPFTFNIANLADVEAELPIRRSLVWFFCTVTPVCRTSNAPPLPPQPVHVPESVRLPSNHVFPSTSSAPDTNRLFAPLIACVVAFVPMIRLIIRPNY